jgi:hypothetical protein
MAGIFTPSTKAELEKAEAEKARLEKALKLDTVSAEKVAEFLPRAVERYRAMIADLANTTQHHVAALASGSRRSWAGRSSCCRTKRDIWRRSSLATTPDLSEQPPLTPKQE